MKTAISRHCIALFPLALLSVYGPATVAYAQSQTEQQTQSSVWNDLDFNVTGGAIYGPDYEGSDDYEAGPLIDAEATWRDTVFLGVSRGLGVQYPVLPNFMVGAAVKYGGGRDQDDNDALRGLGDIDAAPIGNIFLNYSFDPAFVYLDANQSFGGSDGATIDIGTGVKGTVLDDRLTLGATVGTTWASEDYMASYFGIDAQQAARSVYSRYEAESGFKSVGVTLTAAYALTESFSLNVVGGYTRLLGDAADSPIVKDEGSETQTFIGVGIGYSF